MVLVGERLDRQTYSVIRTMGEGSTGVCYLAHHEIFGRDVVQKTVSLLGVQDALAHSEPRLLNDVTHDHLVKVWEAQWDPDPTWKSLEAITFVMPYYRGGSLADVLQDDHRFSLGEAVDITCCVLDALHYLHVNRGILHRDIKPGNIFLDEARGEGFLGDLGSAAPMNQAGETERRGGTLLYRLPGPGTAPYTTASELYAVGLCLLEMLNGRFAYESLRFDQVERRLSSGQWPVAARLLVAEPHVPAALAGVVDRLIARDPRRRFPDALAAQKALQNVRHMDWRRRDGDPDTQWTGRWPPDVTPGHARRYEVRRRNVVRGRDTGRVELTARWRRADTLVWRNFASLTRRSAAHDDAELRAFFRAVEGAAQPSTAR